MKTTTQDNNSNLCSILKYQHRAQTNFPNNMNTLGDMLMISESYHFFFKLFVHN